jgi:hypothetical protein
MNGVEGEAPAEPLSQRARQEPRPPPQISCNRPLVLALPWKVAPDINESRDPWIGLAG